MELDPTFHCDSSPQKHWLNLVKSTKGILIEPLPAHFFEKTTEIRADFRRTLIHYVQTNGPSTPLSLWKLSHVCQKFPSPLTEGNFVNQWTECFFFVMEQWLHQLATENIEIYMPSWVARCLHKKNRDLTKPVTPKAAFQSVF